MIKTKIFLTISTALSLSACQLISPLMVDYNGVRRDVAHWINNHQLMSMQQKRSLVQLSKAQQKLKHFAEYDATEQMKVTQENQIALHCARIHITESKISQLQQQIYGSANASIQQQYQRLAPKFKIDTTQIQCE
ncbi:hypothetical protein [Acinetobacter schindleri]|uniref:hypothetical protein n=1 Tax=Acinetobacter schindleri TaxID=108981 RepID=UPI003F568722